MTGWRKRQMLELAERASQSKQDWWKDDDALEAFAKLVAQHKREACAKLCDTLETSSDAEFYGYEFAEAIRARGQA